MAGPDDGTVAKRIQGKRRNIQKAAAEHTKKNEERASKIQNIRAAFAAEKDGLVVPHIIEMCEQFKKYHLKIAQDGVGARKTGYKLQDNTEEVENFFLSNHQRAGHLDKASGLQEIIDYIDRQINPPSADAPKKPVPTEE